MEKKKQKINCDVSSCKYVDEECEHCTLDEIKVTCDCDECEAEATMCASYEEEEE